MGNNLFTVSSAPDRLVIEGVTTRSVYISWREPILTNGPITGYMVRRK